ncbi:LysR family transcriptional regulator [Ketobacter alkanivorans]|uniref:LysR family transcriptional regulator n=2 Tax=Ketobacter alkanivorans TaxID=1917421 RepID=A0A2K9LR98_9GAMM|nr:LysR family transcriptional regulator [Ketobacter alkanivorans]
MAPKVTLEQWRAFQAVVEYGGYAQAAQAIHKTQSTLSYAVQKLEQSLGLQVLEVIGRKAQLTAAGEVLLRRSRQVLEGALSLEQVAASLSRGIEPRLDLAIDVVFPYDELLCVLAQFSDSFPDTRIELVESVLSGGHDLLLAGLVDVLVSTVVPPGFVGEPLMRLEFVCVTCPEHPLQTLQRSATLQDLKQYRQMVTRDSGPQRRFSAPWLEAEQRWTVSNLTTSIRAIKQGLGFAWVPRLQIQDELRSGALLPLDMEEGGLRYGELYLVYKDKDGAGPATRYLTDLLQASCERMQKAYTGE